MGLLKTYYRLTKPGIIYGNTIVATGGFLLAAKGDVAFVKLFCVLLGTALVIASGCVFNNYIDRGIDKKMARTKKRALVSGAVSGRNALLYAAALGIIGFTVLALGTNWLTFAIGVVGLFFYVVVYGIGKRRTVFGTIIGSISGALPPVAGYTAASGQLDGGAYLLFLILVCWQMPHFYSIAMYRFDDYKAAGLPVMPVKKGMRTTKVNIVGFILLFIAATALLAVFDYAGLVYLVVAAGLGLAWLWKGLYGFSASDDKLWARKMFFFSLIIITALPLLMAVDTYLP